MIFNHLVIVAIASSYVTYTTSYVSKYPLMHKLSKYNSNLNNNIVNDMQLQEIDTSFWSDGLSFGCTGCGKCCQTEGEVWMDENEFADLVSTLHLPVLDVLNIYCEAIDNNWIKLTSKSNNEEQSIDECIFLSDDGKQCTIYNSRPVQCRTYPYWPDVIVNKQKWDSEAVLPTDNASRNGRYWSADEGGCEGINHINSTTVLPKHIHRNTKLYKLYHDNVPYYSSNIVTCDNFKDSPIVQQLEQKISTIQRIVKGTKRWTKEFVIGYNLCPYADRVFSDDTVRYRVCFHTDRSKIIEQIKYEVFDLLANNENEVATTLLILPFAYPDFEDFYDFSLDLEDFILPAIEDSTHPVFDNNSNNNSDDKDNEIQLAFFHPGFRWAEDDKDSDRDVQGLSYDDPIHYEKRAPFPTINLLRAAQVRALANEARTMKIADSNKQLLQNTGAEALYKQFNSIIMESLMDN